MTLKTHKRLLGIASALPLLLLPAMTAMPGRFPMQYGAGGAVSRYGSRYEFLLYLIVPFIIGQIVLARFGKQTEENRRNGRFTLGLAAFILFAYFLLQVFTITTGFRVLSETWVGFTMNTGFVLGIVGVFLAVVLVLYGNHMPKLAFRSPLGFHTAKTTANETAWARVHRRCGVAFVLVGIGLAAYSLLFVTRGTSGVFLLVTALGLVAACYIINWLS